MEGHYLLFMVLLIINVMALILSDSNKAWIWFLVRLVLVVLSYLIYIFNF